MIVYTSKEFVKWAKVAAAAVEQCYCNSDFGSDLTNAAILEQYTTETAWDMTHAAETKAKAAAAKKAGVPLWGWDCVNLVKGLLYGWQAKVDDPTGRGGAKYKNNGVPDATIEDLYKNYCTEQSTDFSHIEIGEFVVYSKSFGHCGIYIGGGYMIEATTKWDSKVQITRILNVPKCSGEYPEAEKKTRTWWAHGKLPWVNYADVEPADTIKCPCCGCALNVTLTPANVRTYIVKSGNTLWGIARDELGNGNRWPEIARLNGIIEGQSISTGQKLYIPNK